MGKAQKRRAQRNAERRRARRAKRPRASQAPTPPPTDSSFDASFYELPTESQNLIKAFYLLRDHGVWTMSIEGEDGFRSCAVDWERLRAGGCAPYHTPDQEEEMRVGVAKAWQAAEGKSVRVFGAEGHEVELARVLAMEGNLGDRFEGMRERILH